MRKKLHGLLAVLMLVYGQGKAQAPEMPLGYWEYHLIDRLEIRSGQLFQNLHTSEKPYRTDEVVKATYIIDSLKNQYLGAHDRYTEYYIRMGHDEYNRAGQFESKQPILKTFYTNKADLFKYVSNDFMIRVNPVFNLQLGDEQNVLPSNGTKFTNTRGIDVAGWVGKRLGFYANITENQFRAPIFYQAWIDGKAPGAPNLQALPGAAYYKNFKTNAFDYLDARGHINFKVLKIITLTAGHDKNFIGNGYRSLFLSDNAAPYDFAKIQLNYKWFQYEVLYANLVPEYTRAADHLLDTKMFAMHHLSVNLGNHINAGLFEAVMSSSINTVRPGYFNPIILYRSQEYYNGSPDKVHIGGDIKVNVARCLSFYGQLLIDDFNLTDLKKRDGWWGNKQAFQLGVKYIDVAGIKNLDLQLEMNQVAPYTYMHDDTVANYTHYNQPLAHPWGANLREFIGIIRYKPAKKLYITAQAGRLQTGLDMANPTNPLLTNYGQNIFESYLNRPADYNVKLLQGDLTTVTTAQCTISYELKYNMYLDVQALYRTLRNTEINSSNGGDTKFVSVGFRMYMPAKSYGF